LTGTLRRLAPEHHADFVGIRSQRVIAAEHLKGVMRLWGAVRADAEEAASSHRQVVGDSTLLRPLAEYEALFDSGAMLFQAAGGDL